MYADIVDLREFYLSPVGRMAEQSITMALSSIWQGVPDERLMGLGYALPYLDRFKAGPSAPSPSCRQGRGR